MHLDLIEGQKVYKKQILAAVLLNLLIVSGCEPKNPAIEAIDNYQARIGNVLELASADLNASLTQYPAQNKRQWPINENKINLLEFLQLKECGLQSLVGQRNSGLGKFMPADQLLVYKHELILGLKKCVTILTKIKADPEDTQRYKDYIANSESNLSKLFFNATFGSDEFKTLFSSSRNYSVTTIKQDYSTVLDSLQLIQRVGNEMGGDTFNTDLYQKTQNSLIGFNTIGDIIYLINRYTDTLNTIALTLENTVQTKPICLDQYTSPKAKVLKNIFFKFYAYDLQASISSIFEISKILFSEIVVLSQHSNIEIPEDFRVYIDETVNINQQDSHWNKFSNAINRHTKAWQLLFKQCDMMPS